MEFDSIEALQQAMRAHDYICDRALATIVFLAMKLEKPILLEAKLAWARLRWPRY